MCRTHQTILSQCDGYKCHAIVSIHYEIEEWDDEYAHIVMEDDNALVTRLGGSELLCLECQRTNNIDRLLETKTDTPHWEGAVRSMSKHLITGYHIKLKDINGEIYTDTTVLDSIDGTTVHYLNITPRN